MIVELAKKALALPIVFDSYQALIGAPECHRHFILDVVQPQAGEHVLDIGCGVGASLRYMPDGVAYVGIDISESYIAKAKADYGERGKFICADVTKIDSAALGTFDRAFCFGVVHHLPDAVAAEAVGFVSRVVKAGGLFATIDPCRVPGQNAIAKLLIDHDRGEFIRSPSEFERIISPLGQIHTEIRHDLLRIPYTQIIMRVAVTRDAGTERGTKAAR
jgi:SAM-dependent methyltransferase